MNEKTPKLLESSAVAFRILMQDAIVRNTPRLEESIIGRRAVIDKEHANGQRIRLHAGDETELKIAL